MKQVPPVKALKKDSSSYEKLIRKQMLVPFYVDLRKGLAQASAAAQALAYADQVAKKYTAMQVAGIPIEEIQRELDRIEGQHRDRVKRTFRTALGVDIGPYISKASVRGYMERRVSQNVDLIKTIPTTAHDNLKKDILKTFTDKPFDQRELMGLLQNNYKSSGYNVRRLTRDQNSKMIGQLNQLRQQEIGVARYRWLTADDQRVRPTHQANNGRMFRWDSPPKDTGHPGNDIQCRCVASAVLSKSDITRLKEPPLPTPPKPKPKTSPVVPPVPKPKPKPPPKALTADELFKDGNFDVEKYEKLGAVVRKRAMERVKNDPDLNDNLKRYRAKRREAVQSRDEFRKMYVDLRKQHGQANMPKFKDIADWWGYKSAPNAGWPNWKKTLFWKFKEYDDARIGADRLAKVKSGEISLIFREELEKEIGSFIGTTKPKMAGTGAATVQNNIRQYVPEHIVKKANGALTVQVQQSMDRAQYSWFQYALRSKAIPDNGTDIHEYFHHLQNVFVGFDTPLVKLFWRKVKKAEKRRAAIWQGERSGLPARVVNAKKSEAGFRDELSRTYRGQYSGKTYHASGSSPATRGDAWPKELATMLAESFLKGDAMTLSWLDSKRIAYVDVFFGMLQRKNWVVADDIGNAWWQKSGMVSMRHDDDLKAILKETGESLWDYEVRMAPIIRKDQMYKEGPH